MARGNDLYSHGSWKHVHRAVFCRFLCPRELIQDFAYMREHIDKLKFEGVPTNWILGNVQNPLLLPEFHKE